VVNKEGCAFTSASADGRRLIYACSSMPVGTHTVTFSTEKFGGWPGGKGGPARGWGSLGRGGLGRHSPGLLEGNPQAQPLARCAASWPPKRRLARHTRHGQRTGLLGRPICSPGDRARSPTHPPTPPAASLPQAAPLRPASSWLSSRAPSWTWPPPSPRTPSASPASPASSPCRWGGGGGHRAPSPRIPPLYAPQSCRQPARPASARPLPTPSALPHQPTAPAPSKPTPSPAPPPGAVPQGHQLQLHRRPGRGRVRGPLRRHRPPLRALHPRGARRAGVPQRQPRAPPRGALLPPGRVQRRAGLQGRELQHHLGQLHGRHQRPRRLLHHRRGGRRDCAAGGCGGAPGFLGGLWGCRGLGGDGRVRLGRGREPWAWRGQANRRMAFAEPTAAPFQPPRPPEPNSARLSRAPQNRPKPPPPARQSRCPP
jgi:hypothetical protein